MQKTFVAKPNEIERKCYVIDATDKILGKIATKAATVLRGKHKVIFTPNVDTGDMVIVINAEKVKVTGNKLQDKIYARYSGFHSGRKTRTLAQMLDKNPEKVIEKAVWQMIPKGPLGNSVRMKLKVYAGDKHPHQAQKPVALEV